MVAPFDWREEPGVPPSLSAAKIMEPVLMDAQGMVEGADTIHHVVIDYWGGRSVVVTAVGQPGAY
jgi:hypothetical protein